MNQTEANNIGGISDNADVVGRLVSFLVDKSLPLWSSVGLDRKTGSFIERLNLDGSPDVCRPRRIRVQARQIYSFAKAFQMGWFPDGASIALEGLRFLQSKSWAVDGRPGYVHLLNVDGTVLDASRDAYDHAFVLLALATTYAISHDPKILKYIDEAVQFLERCMRAPSGGFVEGVPLKSPRRQNPHMHLFESVIALYDATGCVHYQDLALELYELFAGHFYDAPSGTLGEYFEDDLSPVLPAVVEPGHQAEWVWLLWEFERISSLPTSTFRQSLLTSALRYRDKQGFLVDEGDRTGRPTKETRRLWPQTELAKAWIAQAATHGSEAGQEALEAFGRLERSYLKYPVPGGWYEHLDQAGQSLVDFIPATSLYHLVCAIAEGARALKTGSFPVQS